MLTLPNLLTLSRIFAVPILVFLLWRPAPWDYAITFVLYCVVGITDYFDGYLARAQGRISRLGQFLDPIADKIMVAAVLVMLMASRKADGNPPIIQDWSVIPALVILLREIIVSGLREYLAGLQVSVAAVWTGARARGFSLADAVGWVSTRPAAWAGLGGKGTIAVGRDADLVAFAPDAPFEVHAEELEHRNPVSAFDGAPLSGRARRVWIGGSETADGVMIGRP